MAFLHKEVASVWQVYIRASWLKLVAASRQQSRGDKSRCTMTMVGKKKDDCYTKLSYQSSGRTDS